LTSLSKLKVVFKECLSRIFHLTRYAVFKLKLKIIKISNVKFDIHLTQSKICH